MTPQQVDLVQHSFAGIAREREQAAALFYEHLFHENPDLIPMFNNDMAAQGRKLIDTLAMVIDRLQEPETVLPDLRALAIRHVEYGVVPGHYPAAGRALIGMLLEMDGAMPNAAIEAWHAAYALLSREMIAAAYGGPAAPPSTTN